MSVRSDITREMGWFRHEAKLFNITVTDTAGDPVNLASTSLLWRVVREEGNPETYLSLTDGQGLSVSGAGNNIVGVQVDPDTDYDGLEAGVWRHELWDTDNEVLLSYGDAWLWPAADPVT